MSSHSRLDVHQTILDQGLMPLFYNADPDLAIGVAKACYAGGGRLLEYTNRGDKALPVFQALMDYARHYLPGMKIGVGSIADAGTASLFIQMGAAFIVSPSLREDIIRTCNRRKVACLPGCATLTEIGLAEEWGCEIVKLFPAGVYGPNMIKAIKGPQPWSHVMPTGGVSPEADNIRKWVEAGAVCLGMGSKLIKAGPDGAYDLDRIQSQTKASLDLIAQIRAEVKG